MIPDSEVVKSLSGEFHLTPGKGDFLDHLANAINYLIRNDFSRLVQILYRMDVSEKKLKEMLVKHPDDEAGLIIGKLLIERESQRIRTRRQFNRNDNIPEDEKW